MGSNALNPFGKPRKMQRLRGQWDSHDYELQDQLETWVSAKQSHSDGKKNDASTQKKPEKTMYRYLPNMIEGILEVKLPTIWTDGKAAVRRVREQKKRSEKIREEKK